MDKFKAPVMGDNQKSKSVENAANHKKIASHLQEAAKSHLEAAKHFEAGNLEKAKSSTVNAKDHAEKAQSVFKQEKPKQVIK